MKNVLALDGGGIFGIGQASLLSSLPNYDNIDVVAGTSIGSVLGAMIANDIPADHLLGRMKTMLPAVFHGCWWRHYMPITPRYSDKNLNKILRELFPGQFRDCSIPMFVTAADLNNKTLKVYYSQDTDDGALPMWEVLRRAVAAESYFKPWKGMGDGGIYANNPSMVAVAGACDRLNIEPDAIRLFSIGTGKATSNENIGNTVGWTMLQWGAYILEALLNGASSTMHEFFVERMPLAAYERVQFVRHKSWKMDDPRDIDDILSAWDALIMKATPKLKKFFE
jgi:predicted acylesterase/phospholipase RssA